VPVDPALYRRHRYPAEIISHAVWLYFHFNLSHRDVEELLAERGIQVSYEAIRLCAASSAGPTPSSYADDGLDQPISGTWTRCSSRSGARSTGCGEQSIKTASCLTSSYRNGAMKRRPWRSCVASWPPRVVSR